uniref:Uncharacterized protein LOC102810282 n=1 Tax=Saccoglossus kowalevskii TaxID=10224 RepID=A0ABM0MPF0_SACKO|nr:PREDICTED: uncharacterized protein LOC102810282 [Saccoglossus kowalevskii]
MSLSTKEDQKKLSSCIAKYEKEGWNREDNIPDVEPEFCYPLLHWACALGKVSTVKYLIKTEGYNPNQLTDQRDSGIHRAVKCLGSKCQNTTKNIVQLEGLLNIIPENIGIVNSKGETPLLLLVKMRSEMETNPAFFSGAVSLICACSMKLSAESRFRALDTQNKNGDTALHQMVQQDGMLTDIKRIVEAKCKLGVENGLGLTPLFLAEQSGKQNYVKLLLDHMPSCMANRSRPSPLRKRISVNEKYVNRNDDDSKQESATKPMKKRSRTRADSESAESTELSDSERMRKKCNMHEPDSDLTVERIGDNVLYNSKDCAIQIKAEVQEEMCICRKHDKLVTKLGNNSVDNSSGLLRYLTMSPPVKQQVGNMLQDHRKKLETELEACGKDRQAILKAIDTLSSEEHKCKTRMVQLLNEVEKLQNGIADMDRQRQELKKRMMVKDKELAEQTERMSVLNQGLAFCSQ